RRIRHSEFKSPYASAVVLPRIKRDLNYFLDEHALQFPGIHVVALPERSYPSGSIGSEFLGLLGEISPTQLGARAHPGLRAGAIVMNPRDGSVYALASYPRFDQARAATNPEYLRALLNPNDPRHLLVNRATQGMYPTGSTFKPIVAEAGLASGLIGPYSTLPCTSTYTVGNHVFHNVEASVNASLTLPQALSISCDTWFYRLGAMFYGEQQRGHLYMQDWARRLGVGHPTGFDVPGEAAGLVPTPGWLKRTFKQAWQR